MKISIANSILPSDISLKKLTWVLFELLVTSPIATPDAISVNCTPASENMKKKKMKYFLQPGKNTESCAEYTPFEMFIIKKNNFLEITE